MAKDKFSDLEDIVEKFDNVPSPKINDAFSILVKNKWRYIPCNVIGLNLKPLIAREEYSISRDFTALPQGAVRSDGSGEGRVNYYIVPYFHTICYKIIPAEEDKTEK